MNRFWFRTRKYGWGWTPATWEGWTTIFVYGALIIYFTIIYFIRLREPDFNQVVSTIIYLFLVSSATAILVSICYKTGEKPSWNLDAPRKAKSSKPSKHSKRKKKK